MTVFEAWKAAKKENKAIGLPDGSYILCMEKAAFCEFLAELDDYYLTSNQWTVQSIIRVDFKLS